MAYVPINNNEIDPDSPLTSSLVTRLRDNPIAIANGDSGAPQIQTAAYANNSVTVGKVAFMPNTLAVYMARIVFDGAGIVSSNLPSGWAVGYVDGGATVTITVTHNLNDSFYISGIMTDTGIAQDMSVPIQAANTLEAVYGKPVANVAVNLFLISGD